MNQIRSKFCSVYWLAFVNTRGLRMAWFAVAPFVIGCGFFPAPDQTPVPETQIVLTFDDGPLAADVSPPERETAGASLLDPLHQILATLQKRNIRAVFYVSGPVDSELEPLWTTGILAVHDAGHVLAYHAFNHNQPIWNNPIESPPLAWELMEQDYRTLHALADRQLTAEGLRVDEVFSPVFREPFGGGLMGWRDGPVIAERLGWVCRGFALDSMDWTINADVDPSQRDALLALAEGDAVLLVTDRLQAGGKSLAARPVVDVLFHVNSLTASHLGEWIDTVVGAFGEAGVGRVTLGVPDEYLMTSDPATDSSSIILMLLGRDAFH